MGMTIEEAKMGISIDDAKYCLKIENLGISTTCKHFKANAKAINIMEKYQQIEEIMQKEYTDKTYEECLVDRLYEIRKVVEDGNDT